MRYICYTDCIMKEQISIYVRKHADSKSSLGLLQVAYLIVAVMSVIICGIVGLFNQSLGVGMLIFPLVIAIALCMNVVSWALIKLGIEASGLNPEKKEEQLKTNEKSSATRTKKTVVKKK